MARLGIPAQCGLPDNIRKVRVGCYVDTALQADRKQAALIKTVVRERDYPMPHRPITGLSVDLDMFMERRIPADEVIFEYSQSGFECTLLFERLEF